MTCSITIASRPSTTPAARVRTAPQVPAVEIGRRRGPAWGPHVEPEREHIEEP
jgi:hypothetical protein